MFEVAHFYTLSTMPEDYKALNLHHSQWTIGDGWRIKFVLQHIINVILGHDRDDVDHADLAERCYDEFVRTHDDLTVQIVTAYAEEMTRRRSDAPFIIMVIVDNDYRHAICVGYEN